MPVTVWIAVAIVVVLVTRRFSPLVGSALGILLTTSLLVWGIWTYGQGGGMAFAGVPIPRIVFLLLIAAWFGVEAFSLWQALKARRLRAQEPPDAGE
ncbi:MAG: hypothetical protein HYZ27_00365 [Deltaproteobacteria bacterium]|nr:hypothetical protein [Deltaproteobacteria bacterium]